MKWDVMIPFDKLWEQYNRICKDNAAVLLFGVEPFTSLIVTSNLANYRQKLTWLKKIPTNVMNAKKQFMNWTEDIIVFYRKLPVFHPQMVFTNHKPVKQIYSKVNISGKGVFGKNGQKETYTSYNNGYVYPKSVIQVDEITKGYLNKNKKYYHPTQKPVDLIRYLIRTYSNPGDIVLDNCMGSGTTAIAAMREQRNFIGFELDPDFFETCQRRLADEKSFVETEKKKREDRPFTVNPLF